MRFFARCLVERCRLDNILRCDILVVLLLLLNNLPGPCGRVDCFGRLFFGQFEIGVDQPMIAGAKGGDGAAGSFV